MCESGGNYGAVNPSSGAGGAYQIMPSTWELYGGEGAPQDASPAEQDAIAAQIWATQGQPRGSARADAADQPVISFRSAGRSRASSSPPSITAIPPFLNLTLAPQTA